MNIGDKVTIVKLRHPEVYPSNFTGKQGTITEIKESHYSDFKVRIEVPGVEVQSSFDWYAVDEFEAVKEAKKTMLNKGDKVLISNCTGATKEFNGKTGEFVGNAELWRHPHINQVCFDRSGRSCGWLFADSELTKVTGLAVGSKVTVKLGSDAMEFVGGTLFPTNSVVYENPGSVIAVYEITNVITNVITELNRCILRRLSDQQIFFVNPCYLKEYVATPKFTIGQVVATNKEYCRIVKVNNDGTYDISYFTEEYSGNGCGTKKTEDELKVIL